MYARSVEHPLTQCSSSTSLVILSLVNTWPFSAKMIHNSPRFRKAKLL